ncbi:MAG: PD-(D/E)XK nuclease family protein [Patescibacteria group bacterium]|nr:PD-(D/E)XK nuclease family protein [Patescibacteria group bacterium]MDE2438597.1 PD-(D/E)XK nuclease family protein [Patescibacteria group bacterium]
MRRTRNCYHPESTEPFRLSRSKLELYLECPRCFYLDRRVGVGRPEGFPFTLNKAVDFLLKKEFDIHRAKAEAHPLMIQYHVDAIPFAHSDLDTWRENFVGVHYLHEPTNLIIFGAVDDVWLSHTGELIVVDYKATSTMKEITLDEEYRSAYKRQMEIYQWLLRRNGFEVSNTGYFVYVNGKTDNAAFDGRLDFDVQLLSYTGNDAWVEPVIYDAHRCLQARGIPEKLATCRYCEYVDDVHEALTIEM